MNPQKELEAWKIFLKGRILQEEGKDNEALKYFEEASKIEPNNSQFLNAKAFALQNLKRTDEALLNIVKSQYSKLATKLVEKNDKPEQWLEGLNEIVNNIEKIKVRPMDKVRMVW